MRESSDIILHQPPLLESPFDPVWISSHEHLERFQQIRDATPWYRVLFGGTYKPPPDFPSTDIGTQKFPLVYFSSGALTITKNLVTYAARSYPSTGLGKPKRNLNTSLAFSINKAERPTFLRFRAALSPSYFSINWIELTLPGNSLLLCAGGSGPGMGRVQRRTNTLFNALVAWARDQPSLRSAPTNVT
jgi:hypothetical protein